MAWRSRKDVHSGTLCRDTTGGDGGRAEPAGSGEAIWRSPEHDHEDAPVFRAAGLSASRAACLEETRSVRGVDRQNPGGRPKRRNHLGGKAMPAIERITSLFHAPPM